MRCIKAVVQYDGTEYFGFQRQPGRRTIQGELERAVSRVMKEEVRVTGAGRTDAGVHARGQVISFQTGCSIPTDKICVALNSVLPRDITFVKAEEEKRGFSARYSAQFRVYEYSVLNAEQPSALAGRFSWYVPGRLNVAAMRRAATELVGVNDFAAFSLSRRDGKTTVRNLVSLDIQRRGEMVTFSLKANGFLHSMVRGIVGTLIEVGQNRRRPEDIRTILENRDRSAAGKTAPARGLCLVEVIY